MNKSMTHKDNLTCEKNPTNEQMLLIGYIK